MNEQAILEKQPKHRTVGEIMKNPTMRAKLNSYIDEAVKIKTKIQSEQQMLKSLREAVVEELGLKASVFNSQVDMMFKNDYQERLDKYEELYDMVHSVMRDADLLAIGNTPSSSSYDD